MDTFSHENCMLCPRRCQGTHFCGAPDTMLIARAALHPWEEPCISGDAGSGCVFFCGCNLHCIFCQNYMISQQQEALVNPSYRYVTPSELAEIYLHLQKAGAHNINLVSGAPYVPLICESIDEARQKGLLIPIVYNTSSYETVSALRMLKGRVDIYLPDFKLWSSALSLRYLKAEDYRHVALEAIDEMVRQCAENGPLWQTENPQLLQKGVVIRHLVLPGCVEEGKKILYHLYQKYGNKVLYSIMAQYMPIQNPREPLPDALNRPLHAREYDALVDYALSLGIEEAYVQELCSASEMYVPPFDGTIA